MSVYGSKHQLSKNIADIWISRWLMRDEKERRDIVYGLVQSLAKTMTIKELNEWLKDLQVQNGQTKRTTT